MYVPYQKLFRDVILVVASLFFCKDLGWNPFVSSWLSARENRSERSNLSLMFDNYVPACIEALKTRFKTITPIVEISHVQMLCHLLEAHLTPANIPLNADNLKETFEIYFVFCAIWAFGGALFQDQLADHRIDFSKWWTSEFKVIKFPSHGTIFDYYIDAETKRFEPWTKRVGSFTLNSDLPIQVSYLLNF